VFYVTGPIRDEWGTLLTAAGICQLRVHDARHTAVALLLAQGVVVMEIVGHSQISMTSRYAVTSSRR
jgi:integrase